MASQLRRIAQEEAFVVRCGQVGDDLGSHLVAACLVSDLMRLCFLMARRYAPYIKWFGRAFVQLGCAEVLIPIFSRVLESDSWQERQTHLGAAYEAVAGMHSGLGLTEPLAPRVSHFHGRPFPVIHADRFVGSLRAGIKNEEALMLPEHLGSVDRFVDSTDAWDILDRLRSVYAQG